jgi:hypothetical protein
MLSTEINFLKSTARTLKPLKVRNEVIRNKTGVTQTVL